MKIGTWYTFTSARRFLNDSALVASDTIAFPARLVFSSLGEYASMYILIGTLSTQRAKKIVCPLGHTGAVHY